MRKNLQQSEFENIIKPLPAKDRTALRGQELTATWLEENIEKCRKAMKRDTWVGIPWFILYSIALFTQGLGYVSLGIFAAGMVYFMYAFFTTGSFGQNRKRAKVYEELLGRMK